MPHDPAGRAGRAGRRDLVRAGPDGHRQDPGRRHRRAHRARAGAGHPGRRAAWSGSGPRRPPTARSARRSASGFFSVADDRVSILARQALLSPAIDTTAAQAALDAALADGDGQEESAHGPLLPGSAARRRRRILTGTRAERRWPGCWRSSRAGRCCWSWRSRRCWPVGLASRRILLGRSGGTVECGLRASAAATWRLGLAAYQPDQLYWFSAFGLRLRPDEAFDRRSLSVLARRPAARDGGGQHRRRHGGDRVPDGPGRPARPAPAHGRAGHERGGAHRASWPGWSHPRRGTPAG